jgi:hypothetical protein
VIAHDEGLLEAIKYRPIGVHDTRAAKSTLKRTDRRDRAAIAPMRMMAIPALMARMTHTECSTLCPVKRWWNW